MAPDSPLEVRTTIEIRWRDLDMLGHLNQSVYHELLEEGRAALFRHLASLHHFVLARVELDYKLEVRRDHSPVVIVARIAHVGRSSVTVGNDVLRNDGSLAATGTSVHVGWDPEERRSRTLTDDERARLTAALGAASAQR